MNSVQPEAVCAGTVDRSPVRQFHSDRAPSALMRSFAPRVPRTGTRVDGGEDLHVAGVADLAKDLVQQRALVVHDLHGQLDGALDGGREGIAVPLDMLCLGGEVGGGGGLDGIDVRGRVADEHDAAAGLAELVEELEAGRADRGHLRYDDGAVPGLAETEHGLFGNAVHAAQAREHFFVTVVEIHVCAREPCEDFRVGAFEFAERLRLG